MLICGFEIILARNGILVVASKKWKNSGLRFNLFFFKFLSFIKFESAALCVQGFMGLCLWVLLIIVLKANGEACRCTGHVG
jgi:hypothetical protein